MATHTSNPEYHHGNLRQALLDAGEKLLESVGVDGLTLRGLARETGVSHAAPYRHFADKADLLAALAARGFDRLARALVATAGEHAGDPRGEYLASCRRYIELGRKHPAMYRLMFGQPQPGVGDQPELAAAGQAAFDALTAAMRRGVAAGLYRDASIETLAMAVWALVHGLTELAIAGRLGLCGEGDAGRLSEDACALLLRGIGTSRPGA
ncbi:TetR/AcrR family transcriptional regulator [Solidesulfovibrio sp.]|uniref:TetR/AcrR family transcriptional regulator n=1 Tax=Solidesulfovibrio sp. TaxID=2910990 RepID=UPI00263A0F97|nr:TetR/AcrR family transcriptional regulator [Solidesulfovibrio sp.]